MTAERVAVATAASAPVPVSIVWAALADVADPEIPTISVVDLGVVRGVESGPDTIRVEILPTFVGCPAIEMMRTAIADRLAPYAERIEVQVSFAEPWTSDRISPEGRRRLVDSGFGPPAPAPDEDQLRRIIPLAPVVACPFCGSRRTTLENAFGPSLCRSIYHCADCRQPFEQFKAV